jgi:predicted alpha/beta superfamily hydrolase
MEQVQSTMSTALMPRLPMMGFPIVFVLASAWNAQAQSNPPARTTLQHTLHSPLLNEDRRILIRLPRLYETDTTVRYPVLYKFDGDNQLQRYNDAIDILSSFDAMPDMIVVAMPNGPGHRNRDLTPASLHQVDGVDGGMGTGEMGRGDRFLDFVEQELIPYINKQYRTTPQRILAGHSRGALMVLQSLLSKPDLFQARFMFSAPLTRDEQRLIIDTRKFFKEHPGHKSFLYCNWGEAENPGMNQSYLAMKALLIKEAPKGLRWTIERARAGDHQQTQLIALPSALHEYFGGGATANSTPGNRTARVTSRPGQKLK